MSAENPAASAATTGRPAMASDSLPPQVEAVRDGDARAAASCWAGRLLPPHAASGAVILSGERLTVGDVVRVARGRASVRLSERPEIRARIDASRAFVERAVAAGQSVYGITTGFGGMADVPIAPADAAALQVNAVWYHKTGAGQLLPAADVRAAMVARANSHARGVSGASAALLDRLLLFLNQGVTPHVREFGSIGASGDLVPMASITGALIGLDPCFTVDFKGMDMSATEALARLGVPPLPLRAKEALAMMNGTSASTGIAANCVEDARRLISVAFGAHALGVQALGATEEPFLPFAHDHKPHAGQRQAARTMLALLAGSKLTRHSGGPIQDRYSIRCLPQYLGPVLESLDRLVAELEIELNSATDNPLIDCDGGRFYHCGNFLGQYVGLGMDRLRADIGLVAKHLDAQIALLVTPEFSVGLPPSLVGNPDRCINMGLKGLQLTANALMPLLTFLGNPLVPHFPTHAEQYNQNVNSQSFGAANLARQSVDTFRQLVAIALLFGVQAADLRTHLVAGHYDARAVLSPASATLYSAVRELVERQPSRRRPYVWNDDEQALELHIHALVADLQVGEQIARATTDAFTCDLEGRARGGDPGAGAERRPRDESADRG